MVVAVASRLDRSRRGTALVAGVDPSALANRIAGRRPGAFGEHWLGRR